MKSNTILPGTLILFLILGACGQQESDDLPTYNAKSPSEGVVKVEEFPLKYIRKGHGDPYLVIGSADYYSQAFPKALEDEMELIFIDSRHFVPDCKITNAEVDKLSLSTFSDDVEAIRKKLGLEQVGVIGHSVHAQIALDYAVRYPEHTTRLILIAGVPFQGEKIGQLNERHWEKDADPTRKAIIEKNQEILQTLVDTTPPDKYFSLTYHYNAPLYWADPNFDASNLLDNLRTCPAVMGKLFSIVPNRAEVQMKVDKLKMPALLILGKLDFAIPYEAWEIVIEGQEKVQYVLMEKASHNPQTEPSTVNAFHQHLSNWLNTLE